MQKTLVVLKPDTIGRSIIGEIIARFERAGLRLAGLKMLKPDRDFLFHHYETIGQMITRRGQQAFDVTLDLMLMLPVVAIVLEWVESVDYVRKIVWSTEPKSAAPGTIRGDYAHVSFAHADATWGPIANLVHASWNAEEAEKEIQHWFSDSELFSYAQVNDVFTI